MCIQLTAEGNRHAYPQERQGGTRLVYTPAMIRLSHVRLEKVMHKCRSDPEGALARNANIARFSVRHSFEGRLECL